jgi:uncharacterized protein
MATPADLGISIEETARGGRWVARTAEGPESEMTFHFRADGALVIDHTGVPPELEGRGIAAALLNHAIDYVREQGLKIEPRCSYVVTAFRRHPEWGDVLAR